MSESQSAESFKSGDSEACYEPSQSSIIRKLLAFKLTFCRKKAIGEQIRLIDEIVRKNNLVAAKFQVMVESLDVATYPASTLPPKYRWTRLIRDLDALSDRLQHLKHLMQHDRVLTAMNVFTFDVWPLTLKVVCRHELEAGNQGDWIKDITALHILCEKYAVDAELAGRVNETDKSRFVPYVRIEDAHSGAVVLEIDEEIEDDRSNQKRVS